MAIETVQVYCYDEQVPAQLVDGVLVRVFNEAGDTFIAQGYTGDAGTGIVEFSLDGSLTGTRYRIRLFKTGVAFDGSLGDQSKSPQYIDIYSPAAGSPTGTNDFDIYGDVFHHPSASDPRLCRCSGYVVYPNGRAATDALLELVNLYNPIIADSNRLVAGGRLEVEADDDGYIEVDLYREGEYRAVLSGICDEPRHIYIPDRNGWNLADILFPVVAQVTYDVPTLALAVGGEGDVVPTITYSDTRVAEDFEDVEWVSSDEAVATVVSAVDHIVVTGVAAGTATIYAIRADDSIVRTPEAGITQTPVVVIVS